MAEVPVRVGQRTKWISGLEHTTTCNDIVTGVLMSTGQLSCSQDQVHLHFALVEVWRGASKVLSPGTRVLAIWEAWGREQAAVCFTVKRIRNPKVEEEEVLLPSKDRLEDMRQSVRETEGKVQRKLSRRSSSLARRSRGQGDTLHPKTGGRSKEQGQGHGSKGPDIGSRNREELRMGIQARMRMMMAQKETIEKELLKLQLLDSEEASSGLVALACPRDSGQDSGLDSGVVTDDGEGGVLARLATTSQSKPQLEPESTEPASDYDELWVGPELRPPPENLELLLQGVQELERLNTELEHTEEEIVALRFEYSMLTEDRSRVNSPLDCFNSEVSRYREINARLLEEITENRTSMVKAGEQHEKAKKMVRRVEFDMNLVEREAKRLEEGLALVKEVEVEHPDEKVNAEEELEIDFDILDEEEEHGVTLTDFGLGDPPGFIEPSMEPPLALASSTLV